MRQVMVNDFRDKAVLVTGGTMGIGLATGLAFGRLGAQVWLTNRWGSADEEEVLELFDVAGAPSPRIVTADVVDDEETAELLEEMSAHHDHVEVFVSNVSLAKVTRGLEDYSLRGLQQSLDFTTWPLVGYSQQIERTFRKWPRYVVGLSSMGPDSLYVGYDFAGAAKAALETLCRYMSYRLFGEDVRVNIVRAQAVPTRSLADTVGAEYVPFARRYGSELLIEAEAVASGVVALCSGLMDGVNGQVMTIDNGGVFADNLMRLYLERAELGLDADPA